MAALGWRERVLITREQQHDLDPILNRGAVHLADEIMAAYKLGRQHAAPPSIRVDDLRALLGAIDPDELAGHPGLEERIARLKAACEAEP
jgi:hypothetical protein